MSRLTEAQMQKASRIMLGVLRLANSDEERIAFFRRLGGIVRRGLVVWVRDHSAYPPALKNEILSALQKAENG